MRPEAIERAGLRRHIERRRQMNAGRRIQLRNSVAALIAGLVIAQPALADPAERHFESETRAIDISGLRSVDPGRSGPALSTDRADRAGHLLEHDECVQRRRSRARAARLRETLLRRRGQRSARRGHGADRNRYRARRRRRPIRSRRSRRLALTSPCSRRSGPRAAPANPRAANARCA